MSKLIINNKHIKTFIFDMDGTLFGYDDVVASINSEYRILKELSRLCTNYRTEYINNILQENFSVDRSLWFYNTLTELRCCGESERKAISKDLAYLYWVSFGKFNVPYDDAIYFIQRIKPYCRLLMITDGHMFNQKSKLYSSGLHNYFPFENVVFSDEAGVMKPDRKIFELAFEKFNANRSTSVFIGDKIDKDIRGANNVGMTSILLRRGRNAFQKIENETDEPTFTVNNYYDLLIKYCRFEE